MLALSVVFALALVGSVTVTTFFVVSQTMRQEAGETAVRLSVLAMAEVQHAVVEARLEAEEFGLEGQRLEGETERRFLRGVPDVFGSGTLLGGEFALYGEDGALIWTTSRRAQMDLSDARDRALFDERVVESRVGGGGVFSGFAGTAELGSFVVHLPLTLPAGKRAVLDVVYEPKREETVIDNIRGPMAALATVAMVATVLMMQLSMGWVLALVDELRRAADSIDAGELDMRLPELGDHEVGYLARSLNRLIGRLGRRAEAQTRFVADASHELATPVAGIRGYVNILRAWGAEDPEVRGEAINAIDRESRRMARLTNDLLRLIRSGHEAEYRRDRFDVNAGAREVLAATATRYRDKSLEFVGPEEGPLYLTGDPDRIEDAMMILVDNAAKYTPEGGRVELRTRRRRDVVIIEVSDTGVGIPHDELEDVFERFYRSDASRSKETGGFGLGLAIAKHIVESSGGTIDVRSVMGVGTMFTIRLPSDPL